MAAGIFELISSGLVPAAGPGAVSHGVLVLHLRPDEVLGAVQRLKAEFGFDIFLDVTAIDWLGHQTRTAGVPRFEVVHHFYSTTHKQRVRLKTRVTQEDPAVPSLLPFYGAAAFMERECHDMYGIHFHGNADLRPILLYEGFVGHPLRKDYPKQQEQPLVPYRN
jgi:NADH-quinone oxidoreductase subunit C